MNVYKKCHNILLFLLGIMITILAYAQSPKENDVVQTDSMLKVNPLFLNKQSVSLPIIDPTFGLKSPVTSLNDPMMSVPGR